MRKLATIMWLGGLLMLFAVYLAIEHNKEKQITKVVTSKQVQHYIIEQERPSMGPKEREFWIEAIAVASKKHNIPAEILTAKIAQETRFNQHLVSTAGAKCAAQIMPLHYKNYSEISEIESCLDKGAEILAKYILECGSIEIGLRCYYAGPSIMKRVDKGRKEYGWYSDAILARVYLAEQYLRSKKDET